MGNTFQLIEVVGVSTVSFSDAVKVALDEANKDNKVSWFEVIEQRGRINSKGEIEFQVTVKIGKKN